MTRSKPERKKKLRKSPQNNSNPRERKKDKKNGQFHSASKYKILPQIDGADG